MNKADADLLRRIQMAGGRKSVPVMDVGSARSCHGKGQYSTPQHAERVITEIRRKREVDLRYYLCPTCLRYHLTKKVDR